MSIETLIRGNYTYLDAEKILKFCEEFNLLRVLNNFSEELEEQVTNLESERDDFQDELDDAEALIDEQRDSLKERQAKIDCAINLVRESIKKTHNSSADLKDCLREIEMTLI